MKHFCKGGGLGLVNEMKGLETSVKIIWSPCKLNPKFEKPLISASMKRFSKDGKVYTVTKLQPEPPPTYTHQLQEIHYHKIHFKVAACEEPRKCISFSTGNLFESFYLVVIRLGLHRFQSLSWLTKQAPCQHSN